jgi:hypothetical protein
LTGYLPSPLEAADLASIVAAEERFQKPELLFFQAMRIHRSPPASLLHFLHIASFDVPYSVAEESGLAKIREYDKWEWILLVTGYPQDLVHTNKQSAPAWFLPYWRINVLWRSGYCFSDEAHVMIWPPKISYYTDIHLGYLFLERGAFLLFIKPFNSWVFRLHPFLKLLSADFERFETYPDVFVGIFI